MKRQQTYKGLIGKGVWYGKPRDTVTILAAWAKPPQQLGYPQG